MSHVVLQQAEGHILQGGVDRGDLREDVDAVLLLIDHPVDTAGLPLDALEPGEVALLLVDVAVLVLIAASTAHLVTGGHETGLPSWVVENPRRRRELVTTNTELNAMATPASIGLRNPAAATGMRTTL